MRCFWTRKSVSLRMFISTESYKHQAAKNLLHQWLSAGLVSPWIWRRPSPICQELKFYTGSDPYYFEHGRPEGPILFVPDITVFHQGAAHLLVEVVHTSEVLEEKLDTIKCFFLDQPVEVWEVTAEEILRQTRPPKRLQAKLLWKN